MAAPAIIGAASRELIDLRRQEAQAAGNVLSIPYETWDFPDGKLQATLEVRERIIAEIRQFQPDLVLTHRPCDYHPDHRAVGQAVQDASYLLTVPLVVPEIKALRRDPVVAYMCDLFTKPYPLEPQIVLDVSAYVDTIVAMLACHQSQLFEWLPYNQGIEAEMPLDENERKAWLHAWYVSTIKPRSRALVPRWCSAMVTQVSALILWKRMRSVNMLRR